MRAGSDGRLGGLAASGDDAAAIIASTNEVEAFRLDVSGNVVGSPQLRGNPVSVGTPDVVATGAGAFQVVFQNHSIAGEWRVYGSPFSWANPSLSWEALAELGAEGSENLGARAAFADGELRTAYRADQRLALSRFGVSGSLSSVRLESRLPHPAVRTIVTHADGTSVLAVRSVAELSHFDPEGLPRSTVPLETRQAGLAAQGSSLWTVSLVEGQPALVEVATTTLEQRASVPVTGLDTLGVETQLAVVADRFALATVSGTELTIGWLDRGGRFASVMSRPVTSRAEVRLAATPRGALAVFADASGVAALALCSD